MNHYLDQLIGEEEFLFKKLALQDIDNVPVIRANKADIREQETCLFHGTVPDGDAYGEALKRTLSQGVAHRRAVPVVRFADGEFAFYQNTLHCNGLYQQAESLEAIGEALPAHIRALQALSRIGLLAPLIFPGNTRKKSRGLLSFLRRPAGDDSAVHFLDFLRRHGIALTAQNYLPFYVVYAFLTSADFARLVDGKKLCLLNSEYDPEACRHWFARFQSHPEIIYRPIPAAYVATQWEKMREPILAQVPPDIDLCLVGAGVGALLVCLDVAERFSIPALDAGHVLNMMNGREDKSNGARLYTLRTVK